MPIAAGIYYAQFNEGSKSQPPVILIHGAGATHQIWPADVRRLSGQRVLAIDLPGHGRSGGIAAQSIQTYAEQLVEFLAALGFYQAVFIGHALGGAVALELAAGHPEHVAGLGLISSGASLEVDPAFLENLANQLTAPTAVSAFLGRCFGAGVTPAMVQRCAEMIKETRHSVLYGDWRASAAFDLRESILQIDAPTWIITGSEDHIIPLASSHFLAERLQAARLQVIAGAGHMVLLEQPAKVAQGLNQFVSALAAARFSASRVRLPYPAQVSAFSHKRTQA